MPSPNETTTKVTQAWRGDSHVFMVYDMSERTGCGGYASVTSLGASCFACATGEAC
jgi:hypothetical protein